MIRLLIFIFTSILSIAQLFGDVGRSVIFSSAHELRFVVTINNPHKGDLHPVHFLIGLPSENYPTMNASFQGKHPCPENCNELTDIGVEWIQKQKLQRLNTATLKVSPYAGQNEYYSEILITIQFDDLFQEPAGNLSKHQKGLLAVRVLNWKTAKDWIISVSPRQRGETDQPFAPLLKSLVDGAEYIIIGPEEFESASQPLLNHRSSFGNDPLTTAYISLEEIYSEFLDDNSEAEAIKLFFDKTINDWSNTLTFTLLMGDIGILPTMYGGSGNSTYASDDLLTTTVSLARGIALNNNYAFIAYGKDGIRIVDFADPDNLVEKGHYNTYGITREVTISGNHAFVATDWNGLQIIGIDPDSLVEKGHYNTEGFAYSVEINGNYAFLADGSEGLRIIDISDLYSLEQKDHYKKNSNIPSVALGRYPARHISDVEVFVEKIIAYETNPELGLWRNRITLAADDVARPVANDTEHIEYSDSLAINYIPSFIDVKKIYLTEYPEVSDASTYGVVKPGATQALFDALDNGTAIINYIGHGSSSNWSQEKLLQKDRGDLQFINTGMKLPIWIAGTCSWGQFDNPNTDAFSEDIIRLPMNGASAIISTSQSIGYTSNWLNEKRLFQAFFPEGNVSDQPIGIIFQSVKTGDSGGQKFHLFGDPGMSIPFPNETLNSIDVNPDTLITLEVAEFSGISPFNSGGSGYVILKDSDRQVERTFGSVTISYILPGATLFQGQFIFSDNNFSGNLITPKDISYSQNPGRLNLYSISNDSTREAVGTYSPVYFTSGSSVQDNEGPIISFETKKGRILKSDDHFRNNETLVIRLEDSLGINLAGEPGHEISLTDLATGDVTDITNGFIYDPNSIQTGIIQPNLDDFFEIINIRIKAWDSANNPSEKEIYLNQTENNSLRLFQVMNYPNPFKTSTQFVFEISTVADISIDIFTLSGRKIKSIKEDRMETGYRTIDWNGKDAFGGELANGVYLYRVKADANGSSISTIGRMAKFR